MPTSSVTKVTNKPLISKSEIKGAYLSSFHLLAAEILEAELWHTVNSKILTLSGETMTKSSLSDEDDMFRGRVAGGETFTNQFGRAA